jgi:hypothetical protein
MRHPTVHRKYFPIDRAGMLVGRIRPPRQGAVVRTKVVEFQLAIPDCGMRTAASNTG